MGSPRPTRTGVLLAALLVTVVPMAWTQSNVSTGLLLGTTVDQEGVPLPGATVRADNVATGLARRAVSDAHGRYRIDLLPSGSYDVRAVLAGFATEIVRGVSVTLGSRVEIEFILSSSMVMDEIVVTAESPLVEVTDAGVAASIGDRAIANLPLQRRNFTDLTLLAPGTVPSDEELVKGGRGGVNIGARQIQNTYNVDGASYHSSFYGAERGGFLPPFTFSQAAIKEFQVIKSPTNLQFGAGGGVVNAITKSGTNEFHGQVFGYFTNEDMVSSDALGRKDDWDQRQYGFALGGPIVRDRLHFFTSLDRQDFLLPRFTVFHDFPEGREADWESLTGIDYETETAHHDTSNDASVILLKLDWQLGPSHLLTGRFNVTDSEAENRAFDYENTGLSNNGLVENDVISLVVSLNSVVSEAVLNEAFVQYGLEQRPRTPNSSGLSDTYIWGQRARWGQNWSLPNWLDEERIQVVDNLSYLFQRHTLRAGLDLDLVEFDNGFCGYCGGGYSYNDWQGPHGFLDGGTPFSYAQRFSISGGHQVYGGNVLAVHVQDEWRADPSVTINYGLRYELQDHHQPQQANPLWPDTGRIPNDTDNWSIMAAFAWDLRGDGRQVVRGGYRRFYDATPSVLDANAMLNNGVESLLVVHNCLFGDPCPTYPGRWDSIGDLEAVIPDIFVFSPDFSNPQTDRVWLGYERQIGREFAIGIDLVYSESEKLGRKQDQNIYRTGELTPDGRPIYGRGGNPNFDQIVQFTSDARAEYTAVALTARKRFANNWYLDASYTWSKARDNDSNERSVGTSRGSSGEFPEDQYDLDRDWGPSAFDVEHKLVAAVSWQLPYNLLVSAIGFYRSGYPYSALDARDNNHDGYRNERALIEVAPGIWAHPGRNTERQPRFANLDLRLSWTARLGGGIDLELIGEAFNLTNRANRYTSAARRVMVDFDGSINSSFGELDGVGTPRRYQLGLKIRF